MCLVIMTAMPTTNRRTARGVIVFFQPFQDSYKQQHGTAQQSSDDCPDDMQQPQQRFTDYAHRANHDTPNPWSCGTRWCLCFNYRGFHSWA